MCLYVGGDFFVVGGRGRMCLLTLSHRVQDFFLSYLTSTGREWLLSGGKMATAVFTLVILS